MSPSLDVQLNCGISKIVQPISVQPIKVVRDHGVNVKIKEVFSRNSYSPDSLIHCSCCYLVAMTIYVLYLCYIS